MKLKILLSLSLLLAAFALSANEQLDGLLKQGGQYFADKQFDKAEQAFRKAVELVPDSAAAWSRLGAFYLTRHKARDAAAAYQQAIIHDPENPKYFVAMAISYLHQGEYNMAHAMTDRALELDPSLKNAGTLAQYIDMRQKVIAQASAADEGLHQGMGQTAVRQPLKVVGEKP